MKIKLQEMFDYLKADLLCGKLDGEISGGAIDSRKINEKNLFFAFSGEKTDGHKYVQTAADAGAVGAVVEKNILCTDPNFPVLKVASAKTALQQCGKLARSHFKGKVIGVTGSNGKTTTKDMIADVLSQSYRTQKTFANFNNELGLPLTIINCPDDKEIMVLEMGMRALGEIASLANIAKPHVGVVTNVGISHMELLKSQENIAKAKFELTASLAADGIAVLNADDEWCVRLKPTHCKTVFYGFNSLADVCCTEMHVTSHGTTFTIQYDDSYYEAQLPTWGRHNIANALAAFAVAVSCGMTPQKAARGLRNYRPSPMRLEIKTGKTGFCIIDDTYNANPLSVAASLEVIRTITDARTVAVLGEMYELGDMEEAGHLSVGQKATENNIDILVTVGKKAALIAQGASESGMNPAKIYIFPDNEQASVFLNSFLLPQDTVLIKGSRGMHMEMIVSALT